MASMLSRINSTGRSIWRKMKDKGYRDSFVAAHLSNTISAQIHSMRKARNWTQSELASRCDMKQSRISALEDPDVDNVEIGTLQRLASAFDVALSVRFVPFSEIARRSTSLASSDFVVRDFPNDAMEESKPALAAHYPITIQHISARSGNIPFISVDVRGDSGGGPTMFVPVGNRIAYDMPQLH